MDGMGQFDDTCMGMDRLSHGKNVVQMTGARLVTSTLGGRVCTPVLWSRAHPAHGGRVCARRARSRQRAHLHSQRASARLGEGRRRSEMTAGDEAARRRSGLRPAPAPASPPNAHATQDPYTDIRGTARFCSCSTLCMPRVRGTESCPSTARLPPCRCGTVASVHSMPARREGSRARHSPPTRPDPR